MCSKIVIGRTVWHEKHCGCNFLVEIFVKNCNHVSRLALLYVDSSPIRTWPAAAKDYTLFIGSRRIEHIDNQYAITPPAVHCSRVGRW